MARAWIRLGDKTSHGGTVIQASAYTYSGGIQVARVGDMVQCPKKGHGTCPIVSGDITLIIDGKPVARHGDKTSCGASLIASQQNSTADQRTSAATEDVTSGEQELSFEDFFTPYDEAESDNFDYDEHFVLHCKKTGEAITSNVELLFTDNIKYTQHNPIVSNLLSTQGETSLFTAEKVQAVSLSIKQENVAI